MAVAGFVGGVLGVRLQTFPVTPSLIDPQFINTFGTPIALKYMRYNYIFVRHRKLLKQTAHEFVVFRRMGSV